MKKRTTFDKVGYWILGLAWIICLAIAAPMGAGYVGNAIAYLLFGSLAFMIVWQVVGWVIRRVRRA